jgi:hypothetical protein
LRGRRKKKYLRGSRRKVAQKIPGGATVSAWLLRNRFGTRQPVGLCELRKNLRRFVAASCAACADCAIDGLLKWICAASIKLVTQWILSDRTFAAGYAPLRGSRNIGAIASPLRTPLSDRI